MGRSCEHRGQLCPGGQAGSTCGKELVLTSPVGPCTSSSLTLEELGESVQWVDKAQPPAKLSHPASRLFSAGRWSAPWPLLHRPGRGCVLKPLCQVSPRKSGEERRASVRQLVSCTKKAMEGEAVEGSDSTQVRGLSAVFNYPHPSSPWRVENWVYLPPPPCCCWQGKCDLHLERLWGKDSEWSLYTILPGTEMSLNNSAPGSSGSL